MEAFSEAGQARRREEEAALGGYLRLGAAGEVVKEFKLDDDDHVLFTTSHLCWTVTHRFEPDERYAVLLGDISSTDACAEGFGFVKKYGLEISITKEGVGFQHRILGVWTLTLILPLQRSL